MYADLLLHGKCILFRNLRKSVNTMYFSSSIEVMFSDDFVNIRSRAIIIEYWSWTFQKSGENNVKFNYGVPDMFTRHANWQLLFSISTRVQHTKHVDCQKSTFLSYLTFKCRSIPFLIIKIFLKEIILDIETLEWSKN